MSPTAIYNFLIGNSWQLMTSMLSSKIHISNNVIMVLTFSNLSRMDSHCWHWSVYVKKRHCGFCSPRPNLSGSSRALQQNTNCSSPLHPCLLGSHRLAPLVSPCHMAVFHSPTKVDMPAQPYRLHLPGDQELIYSRCSLKPKPQGCP